MARASKVAVGSVLGAASLGAFVAPGSHQVAVEPRVARVCLERTFQILFSTGPTMTSMSFHFQATVPGSLNK